MVKFYFEFPDSRLIL